MKALTIGGAMIDTIAIIDSSRIERMTMLNAETSFLLVAQGHKTEALEISTHCGGGAVNTAIALARLGHDVASVVKLGRDQRAETLLATLMQEGVSTRWVMRDERGTTGASVIVSSHDRNAAIFTYRGVNALLESGDLKGDAFAVDLVHVASLSNRSADCFPHIVDAASRAGAFISVNPGIRQLSSRGDVLKSLLARVDLLTVNKTEAAPMVPSIVASVGEGVVPLVDESGDPPSPLARHGLSFGGYELGLASFFKGLMAIGLDYALLTDGAAGAFLADRQRIMFCPAAPATVAGTAGAGDAFAVTVASSLAEGRDPETALKAGAVNAASVVGYVDTQTGLLDRPGLEAALASAGDKLKIRSWPL
jgi:ribokinase